jgi:uncharacterized protein YcbK (DUF882 family)
MEHSRRRLLLGLGGTAAGVLAPGLFGAAAKPHRGGHIHRAHPHRVSHAHAAVPSRPVLASAGPDVRRLKVHNLHTGDRLDAVYFENGTYVDDALAEARRVMRDWRNGQEHLMDPRLFDALSGISDKLESRAPFQIISGYRSPATNAMLHERSSGVASHSQHMLGKASDIRVEGVELRHLHSAALSQGAGGVGFYPVSDFIHVDVGPVRRWTGA